MMMQPSASDGGSAITQDLWHLSRPPYLWVAGDSTSICQVEANNGEDWMGINADAEININESADLEGILQTDDTAGLLPAETVTGLKSFVKSHRGQRIKLWESMPAHHPENAMTLEGLAAAGVLAEPSFAL